MMPIASTTAHPRKRLIRAAWLLTVAFTLPMWGTLDTAHSQTTAAQRNSGRLSVTLPGQTQPQSLYEESHALVIGASAYRNGWAPLKGVKDDVVAVKAALTQNGYVVHVVNDPTRDELDKALRDFLHQFGQKKQNRLLVYFAGHGETLDVGAIGKVGYIVPVDAPLPAVDEAGFKQKAYDMEMIETHAKSINAKHALFVFDSCFSGTIFAATRSASGPPPFITEMTTRPVQQFITSGDANQTVPDKSIFREQFVKALTTREADLNGDHHITGTELGMYLQTTVTNRAQNSRERSKQTPMFGKSRIRALSEGDFVLASLRVEPTGLPLPSPVQGGGLSLEDLEREEATRKAWAQWQARMKADHDKTAAFQGSADLQAKAWERFLAAWGQDNPLSGEDEGLRAQATGTLGQARAEVAQQAQQAQEEQRQQAAARQPSQVTAAAQSAGETLDGRYQILAGGAEVKDLTTGLVWQRCSVGQRWSGSGCTGTAERFKWDAAQTQSGNGWRVPTVRELQSLRVCSKGFSSEKQDLQDGKAQVPTYCAGDNDRPTIHKGAFPQTPASWYWTSSPRAGGSGDAWNVNFYNGYVDYSLRNYNYHVRLVR